MRAPSPSTKASVGQGKRSPSGTGTGAATVVDAKRATLNTGMGRLPEVIPTREELDPERIFHAQGRQEHKQKMDKMKRGVSPPRKARNTAALARVSPDLLPPQQSMKAQPPCFGFDGFIASKPIKAGDTSYGTGGNGSKNKKLGAAAVVRAASPDKGLLMRGPKAKI